MSFNLDFLLRVSIAEIQVILNGLRKERREQASEMLREWFKKRNTSIQEWEDLIERKKKYEAFFRDFIFEPDEEYADIHLAAISKMGHTSVNFIDVKECNMHQRVLWTQMFRDCANGLQKVTEESKVVLRRMRRDLIIEFEEIVLAAGSQACSEMFLLQKHVMSQ